LNPIPYQLWYKRDLTVFALLSPLLYLLIKHIKLWLIPFCLFVWFYEFDFIIFRSQSLLFFILGALISKRNEMLLIPKTSRLTFIFGFLWIVFVIIRTRLFFLGEQYQLALGILHKISILLGILAINFLYDFLFKNVDVTKASIYKFVTFSFFIFVSHEPLITIIKKGLFFLVGNGEAKSVFIFIICPLLTIPMCISVGYFLKKNTPKFYGVIKGWR